MFGSGEGDLAFFKKKSEMQVYGCNLNTWEAEAGGFAKNQSPPWATY